MAVHPLLRRATNKAHPQAISTGDTARIPDSLVVGTTALSGTEILRVAGETQIDGVLHGISNGSGLVIGKVGTGASTGSALQIQSFTTTQRGFLVAATGMSIYNSTLGRFQSYNGTRWGDEATNNNFQATTDPSTSNDATQGYAVGSLWINTTTKILWTCVDATASAAVWLQGTKSKFSMTLGGRLSKPVLPLSGAGIEIADSSYTITNFRARRGVAGSSGTTTIQLEVNGTPVSGATLSWANTDAAFTLKTVTLSQTIAAGDRVSFRLTAVEGGDPQDIYAEAN